MMFDTSPLYSYDFVILDTCELGCDWHRNRPVLRSAHPHHRHTQHRDWLHCYIEHLLRHHLCDGGDSHGGMEARGRSTHHHCMGGG